MDAIAGAVLVWLGSQAPSPADRAALDAWTREHGLALRSPTEDPPAEDDSVLVAGCEHALEQARDELTAGDPEAAQRTLRGLEQLLRDHSELWQAGWLLAERSRLGGRVASALHTDRAAWDERAEAIEGAGARGRAYGDSPARARSGAATIAVDLRLRGAARALGYWDGAPVGATIVTAPGEHHLVVVRAPGQARVAWSGFVSVLRSGPLDLWIAPAPPCSSADLGAVAWSGPRPAALDGVLCPSWVAARSGREANTWELARCARARCDPPVTVGQAVALEPTTRRATSATAEPSTRAHAWKAWAIGFAALAVTSSLVLWGAGAFEPRAPAPRVVVDTSGL